MEYTKQNEIPKTTTRTGKWKQEFEKIPTGEALTIKGKDGQNAIHALYGYQKKQLFQNLKGIQRNSIIYILNPAPETPKGKQPKGT